MCAVNTSKHSNVWFESNSFCSNATSALFPIEVPSWRPLVMAGEIIGWRRSGLSNVISSSLCWKCERCLMFLSFRELLPESEPTLKQRRSILRVNVNRFCIALPNSLFCSKDTAHVCFLCLNSLSKFLGYGSTMAAFPIGPVTRGFIVTPPGLYRWCTEDM